MVCLTYIAKFYESGGPALTSSVFVWFQRFWLSLTVVLSVYYIVRFKNGLQQEQQPNLIKLIFLALTFTYLGYTASLLEKPSTGMVMFESWHDVQYLAIVWLFNTNRVRKGPGQVGAFTERLFRSRLSLAVIYVGLCLAFGMLNQSWRLFEDPTIVRVAVSVVTAVALFHYYLDGFIWKIREPETRQSLGVDARVSPKIAPARVFVWPFRHAVLWLLFVIPAGIFFAAEPRKTSRLDLLEKLVDTFPNSPQTHYDMGRELQDMGRFDESEVQLKTALALNSNLVLPRVALGMLSTEKGDLELGRKYAEEAIRMDPKNAEAQNDLGVIMEQQGDLAGAQMHLERAVAYGFRDAVFENNLGRVLDAQGNLSDAQRHEERALLIDPQYADGHYQIGETLAKEGDLSAAIRHFRRAVEIDPNLADAYAEAGQLMLRQNDLGNAADQFQHALQVNPFLYETRVELGDLLLKQGRLADARAQFEAALRIKGDDVGVQEKFRNVSQSLGLRFY